MLFFRNSCVFSFICLSVFLVWICLGFFFAAVFVFWNIFFCCWMDGNKLSEGHQTLVVAALLVRPAFRTLFCVAIVVVWNIFAKKSEFRGSLVVSYETHTHTMIGVGSFSTALPILRKISAAQPEISPFGCGVISEINEFMWIFFTAAAAAYAWYTPKNCVHRCCWVAFGLFNLFLFR